VVTGGPPFAWPGATSWQLAGGVQVRCTGRADGDMAPARPGASDRQARVVDLPWTLARQVHGADVLLVDAPGSGVGEAADGVVTAVAGAAIAVLTADCAPVALASPEGIAGVAHAGWRGLCAGVIEATVEAMRAMGATDVEAVLGPCIRPECYTFGEDDLDLVIDRLGPTVRSTDKAGAPALDVPAGVRAALAASGVRLVADAGICTSCGDGYWSWRARADGQRQATVAWCP
jgi:polyphenol oxidase